jgi:hypothetical protein
MNKAAGSVAILLFGLVTPPTVEVASAQSSQTRSNQTTQATDTRSEVDDWDEGALFQAFGVGMFATSAGDLATTEWGLNQPGIYEANPLAGNRGVRVSAHVLVPVAVWWTTKRLHKNGHDKTALWVRIAVTAAYGYAVMHNLRTAGSPQPLR